MNKTIAVVLCLMAANVSFGQTYKTPLKLVSPMMNGPEVLAVQTRLIELGFSKAGSADGWFGPATKDAVSSFERFFGFAETGIVDSLVWDALISDSKKRAEIESAIVEANLLFDSKYTKRSHDIMDRSTEGGNVVQYLSSNKVVIEDFTFYGEMVKVEYKVFHLVGGSVVLEKNYRYPQPFDLQHAKTDNVAYYFVRNMSVRVSNGKIENSEITSLSIYDLLGMNGT